ncbi:hypothetical protein MTQ74_11790, partial [Escherichia coli]|nr:hypothetical protein [Escherichia coli]
SIICSPMTSLKTSIKTITYLSDTGCLEIQGASLAPYPESVFKNCLKKCTSIVIDFLVVFLDEKLMQNSVFIMKMMPKRTTRL